MECEGKIIVGRDTRSTSSALATAVLDGIAAIGGSSVTDIGVVTTPQLHYMVVANNTDGAYGVPSLEGYYAKLTGAFNAFMASLTDTGNYKATIYFDGANGVGAPAMQEFAKLVKSTLDVTLVNSGIFVFLVSSSVLYVCL